MRSPGPEPARARFVGSSGSPQWARTGRPAVAAYRAVLMGWAGLRADPSSPWDLQQASEPPNGRPGVERHRVEREVKTLLSPPVRRYPSASKSRTATRLIARRCNRGRATLDRWDRQSPAAHRSGGRTPCPPRPSPSTRSIGHSRATRDQPLDGISMTAPRLTGTPGPWHPPVHPWAGWPPLAILAAVTLPRRPPAPPSPRPPPPATQAPRASSPDGFASR